MNTAFEALNEPATRTRRATAPARDYPPTPAPETFPDVQHGLEPVNAAAFQSLIKKDLAKLAPELGEIVRLAEREAGILEAAGQFSPEAANADHAAELAGLRANLNIERLKSVGTIEDRRKNYQAHASGLRDEAEKVRREAAPLIKSVTARLIRRLSEMGEQAGEAEAEVLKRWGIPDSYPSNARPHFIRATQELAEFVAANDRGNFHGTICSWLKRFL